MADPKALLFQIYSRTTRQITAFSCLSLSGLKSEHTGGAICRELITASRTGTTAGDVAKAGLALLPEAARRSPLAYGLGRGIGAALDSRPLIAPDSTDELVEDMLLSFRIFARRAKGPAFAGGVVQVSTRSGRSVEPLERTGFAGLGRDQNAEIDDLAEGTVCNNAIRQRLICCVSAPNREPDQLLAITLI